MRTSALFLALVAFAVVHSQDTTAPPETTQPAQTTAAPQTTLPPATTQPPETTQPPQTTLPPETTLPPATTQPSETTQPPDTTQPPQTTDTPTTTAAPCPFETFPSNTNVETLVFLKDVFLNDGYLFVTLVAPSNSFELDRVAVGETMLLPVGDAEPVGDCYLRYTVYALWEDVRNETESIAVWIQGGDEIERVSILVSSRLIQTAPEELEGRVHWARQSAVFDFKRRQSASTDIDLRIPESLAFFTNVRVLDHYVKFDQDLLRSTVEIKLATYIVNSFQLNLAGGNTIPEMELSFGESTGCAIGDGSGEEEGLCLQEFTVSFNPMNCSSVEAAVRLSFGLECRQDGSGNATECELPTFPGGGDFPDIPVRLNFRSRMDMCPLFRTSDTAVPELLVFADANRTEEIDDGEFTGDQALYFVASVEDPSVTPYNARITFIRMFKPDGELVIVWDGGDSSVQDFQIEQWPGQPRAEFSFLPSNPPFDSFGDYFIEADLEVTYVPMGSGDGSALLEASNKQIVVGQLSLSKRLLAEAEDSEDDDNAAWTPTPWAAGFVALLLLV